ncbi:MAG: TerC family protein [Candidatus Omnitrophica bacterium]|nr:TerC family protein [Candidatus Omnitrophota bacterium]
MSFDQIVLWGGFNFFIVLMLGLDLLVFNRQAHDVKLKEALMWSGIWVTLALLFNVGIYIFQGRQPALEFLTGYLIEKSLSIDNIFVFILVFSFFQVPAKYQHKVLFWGIFGALLMRAVFIFGGLSLMKHFHGIIYIFGTFLIFTGIKLALDKDKDIHPEKNVVLRIFRRMMPITQTFRDGKFFVREQGRSFATPLFIVLLVIETTDLIFAVDSIPAILAVTRDPFIVYSSNVFAILGLRALYFALAGTIHLFHYLHYGLAAILVFVGAKMLMADIYKIPIGVSLVVILAVLLCSVAASLIWPKLKEERILT